MVFIIQLKLIVIPYIAKFSPKSTDKNLNGEYFTLVEMRPYFEMYIFLQKKKNELKPSHSTHNKAG